jgi:hypothetical protein
MRFSSFRFLSLYQKLGWIESGNYFASLITHHVFILFNNCIAGDRKDVLSEIREKVAEILDAYEPLPLGEDVEKELEKICKKARAH